MKPKIGKIYNSNFI